MKRKVIGVSHPCSTKGRRESPRKGSNAPKFLPTLFRKGQGGWLVYLSDLDQKLLEAYIE